MLFCREKELHMLSEMYNSKNFRFLVMYGRHRVGRTSILLKFSEKKDVIYFRAQAKNDALNLSDFSGILHQHFGSYGSGSFSDWSNALAFISSNLGPKRLTIIIEEFHHIAAENPEIIRLLQYTIDRSWRTKNVFLIISDSNASFVQNDLLDYSSPLYGRVSGHMIVSPLDYLDSSQFLPGYSAEDKLISYAILGGTPCYAGQFSDSVPLAQNLSSRILRGGAFLKEEPQAILRTDFRDPAVYNSILEAIARGARRMNDISIMIQEESQKCAKYLNTLRAVGVIDRITPVGEDDSVKKSMYAISDNFFNFWYRFVFSSISHMELSDSDAAAQEILQSDSFAIYIEEIFKNICLEFLVRKAKAGKLPLAPYAVGRWWSGSSKAKKCQSIDLVATDQGHTAAIFCKCRFNSVPLDQPDLDELVTASRSFGKADDSYYYLFSRSGYSEALVNAAKKNKSVKFFGIDDLFKI